MSSEKNIEQQESGVKREYEVKKSDLPICCPPKEMPLWCEHPRVYLPLGDEEHEVVCPYCDTRFILVDA